MCDVRGGGAGSPSPPPFSHGAMVTVTDPLELPGRSRELSLASLTLSM